MANRKGHRRFGSVRKLPSGRFQARYVGPDGIERTAPGTFETERKADKWLTLTEAEIIKNEWRVPEASEVKLDAYGTRWIAERKLQPRSREGYEDLFRLYIRPHMGTLALSNIKPQTIRTWRQRLLDAGTPEPQAVKAYALLRAILNTAIKPDKILHENPCQIDGYGTYDTPERTPATVEQVLTLAEHMPPRYRALIIVAAFSSLRWGELAALRRRDVDTAEGVVRVPRKLAALRNRLEFGPPKSQAGKRAVVLPPFAVEILEAHLMEFVDAHPDSIIFTSSRGTLLRSSNFTQATKWTKLRVELGLPEGFTFHDLRHTGNNLASATGANIRELMRRMGHSTMRAALIYQHGSLDRDREIAKAIETRVKKASGKKANGKTSDKKAEDPKPKKAKKIKKPKKPGGGEQPA